MVPDHSAHGLTAAELPSFADQPLIDPRQWFHPSRCALPLEIEIGSGKGTFLVQEAPRHPGTNFLGIEYAGEFYRYAADRIARHHLDNVRMLHADAVEFLRYRVPDAICTVLHIYFPDPWPKSRHHKRRTLQESNLRAFRRILTPRGEIRIVTDHEGYWEWIEEHAGRCADLYDREPFTQPASAADGELVGTNFERKYRREGRPFHALVLRAREPG